MLRYKSRRTCLRGLVDEVGNRWLPLRMTSSLASVILHAFQPKKKFITPHPRIPTAQSNMSLENHQFKAHKSRILAEIASPSPDASPKGSIDVQILPLINRLNLHDRVFTTSSCSGRVSVFLEGLKKNAKPGFSEGDTVGKAGIGGKGEGGKWLFVSHDPVDVGGKSDREVAEMVLGKEVAAEISGDERMLGLGSGDAIDFNISSATRFVHLKFEPMVSGYASTE